MAAFAVPTRRRSVSSRQRLQIGTDHVVNPANAGHGRKVIHGEASLGPTSKTGILSDNVRQLTVGNLRELSRWRFWVESQIALY